MKEIIKAVLFVACLVLLTGCGNKAVDVKEVSAQSIIKLGEEYSTIEVVRWEIKDERIKLLSTNGDIYNLLYKDVVIITKGF
ncbi:hypothetical protein J3A84_05515 [Proteiniclasticum sp. SCR006]|uniref:Uncharacterized protein n=1 Tax=Proteiniclasticum aestuarii TaxID=2817862 RepID=A0A939H5B2_9CLOT|nr:hypothetical protein [Proteiniclasticum aestuarii]MBO1264497.1 hypothetical protein [Proteiniclasticum aestuarii]